MDFNLRFKYADKKDKRYWCTTISADTEEEAIEKAKKLVREENYKNAKLTKTIYTQKTIYNFDKEN